MPDQGHKDQFTRWRRRCSAGAALALALAAATGASAAHAQTGALPFDVPVPTAPTVRDALGTTAMDGDGAGLVPGAGLCRSARARPIRLPGDDAAHPRAYHEWWWWYGNLRLTNGRRYGYMMLWESKPWARAQLVRVTISDLTSGSFRDGTERITGSPRPIADGVRLAGRSMRASGGDGRDRLRLRVGREVLELNLRSTRPPVVGSLNAFCNDPQLVSRNRMRTTGRLIAGGRTRTVKGTSNYHHLWGFTPAFLVANLPYLTFALDDGRDILVATASLRENGPEHEFRFGYVQERNGASRILHRNDFTMRPRRFWQADSSCRYPVGWDVEVLGTKLTADAMHDKSEIRTTDLRVLADFPEWPRIWDGATSVAGDATGTGWLDMTHFCYA